MSEWRKVVFVHELRSDGLCPVCKEDYTECPCPGPTMEGWEYEVHDGVMMAREEAGLSTVLESMEDITEQIGKLVYSGGIAVDIDLAMTEGPNGRPMLHLASCPDARAAAARGEPVFTMFGCQGPPPDDIERHSCLTGLADPAPFAAE